ncbi:M13-type metalloendopeptidase [Clostridium weizhouense]|uniref:M13 family metallopeptidase n=1 Tax=Clostridium weizhouense TaxID=2859781 RepID=A0ABS7ASR9_9CLOT|nr:M13 family metallopeptidase [Clostridium weizhouense]MBW6411715.1 M13 family metallopeptidase [Clostridium weizhouense]
MKKRILSILSILICLITLIPIKYSTVMASETSQKSLNKSNEIRLQDDFYKAINQEWIKNSKLKDGENEKSEFISLKNKVKSEMDTIFDQLLINKNKYSENSEEKKVINLYNNFIDMNSRNKQGIEPVKKYINQIKGVKNLDELTRLFSNPEINIFNNLIQFNVEPDNKDGKTNVLYIYSTPLFLGDSAQYKNPSEEFNKNKIIMEKYLNNILKLSGYNDEETNEKVNNLFKFEKMLSPSMLSIQEFFKQYSTNESIGEICNVREIGEKAPNLNLSYIMEELGYDKADKVILLEPKWLEKLNELYTEENLQIIKDYTEVCLISSSSQYLSKDFKDTYSEFEKELYSLKEDKTLEQEGSEYVEKNFGMLFSKLYVKRYFTKQAQKDIEEITHKIIETYKKRINSLDWMTDSTKQSAIKKLDCLKVTIGYSGEWKDYSKLDLKSYNEGSSLFDNIVNLELFSYKEKLNKLNKSVKEEKLPFDLGKPQDVNAYYDVNTNQIIIPAAILQPPFYDANASKEVNLGAIGMIIGHEITHAFDNTGAKFDENGKINNWWNDEDYKEFTEKIQKIINFYGEIEVFPGKKIDGKMTVGENIADIGSMTCMLDILDTIKNPDYDAFFRSFATTWRNIATKEYKELLLKTDSHSPNNIRVNTVLQQFEKFYETYNITEKDGMYVKLEDRLSIW